MINPDIRFLDLIELGMQNMGIKTRAEMATRMNAVKGSSGDWDVEKLNKIWAFPKRVPRPETCATMKIAAGYSDFWPPVYRSEKEYAVSEDEPEYIP